MGNLKKLRESVGIRDFELSAAVQKHMEEHGPVKGLRFDQVNALTLMCEFGYIKFNETLENVYLKVIEDISKEVENGQ